MKIPPLSSVSIVVVLCVASGIRVWAETANRIVAIVNDDIITEADVLSYASAQFDDPQETQRVDPRSVEMQLVVLRRLIEQRLILQEAKRAGVSVATEEILEHLETLRSHFDSDEAFEQSLADSHLTQEQLKEKIREQLMVQRLIDAKIRSTIVVSPQEVAREIGAHPELAKQGDRVRAAHILIRVNEKRSAESARARIEEISKQLSAGAEFGSLAKRYSEDPHAAEGGAMSWVAQGELMPELDAALFRLTPGEWSQPIQTRLGFHLVKVEERKPAESLSTQEAHRTVYQQLYQQKFQDAFVRWLTQLKRHAYIEIPKESS